MNNNYRKPADDLEEGEVLAPQENTLALLNKSEIHQQIATAKDFPRSIANFKKQLLDMVSLDEEVADECIYALPRKDEDGKLQPIEGPSARFAELVLSCWKNARAGARVVDEGAEFITSQGAFYDLENNIAINFEVKRRITTRSGKRYGADMIGVTSNAANSIAFRNAVLKGVPKALWIGGYKKAQQVCAGDSVTMVKKRTDALEMLEKRGVPNENVFRALDVKGVDDITSEKLVLLKGILSAIRNNETTVELVFFPEAQGQTQDSNLAGKSMGRMADIKQRHAPDGASPKTEPTQASSQPAASSATSPEPAATETEPLTEGESEQAVRNMVGRGEPYRDPEQNNQPRGRKPHVAPGQPLNFDRK